MQESLPFPQNWQVPVSIGTCTGLAYQAGESLFGGEAFGGLTFGTEGRQNQTERPVRSALQAIGETGQLIAATGKLVAGNANQLAETNKITGGNAERTDRIERNLDQFANHVNILGSIGAGHAAQPVPPAHQGRDQPKPPPPFSAPAHSPQIRQLVAFAADRSQSDRTGGP